MTSLAVLFLAITLSFGAAAVAFGPSLRRPFARRPDDSAPSASSLGPREVASVAAPDIVPLSSAEILAQLYALALDGGEPAPASSPEHMQVAAAVGAAVESVAADPRYAPRRPLLLPQLLQAVNDDASSRRELAAIIVRDPALVGNLLKLANSAFYRIHKQPIESIERAVAVLGTDGIRSLVATAVMQPVFRATRSDFAQFPEVIWEHTFRSAAAAEAHAAFVEKADRFAAQLLGLLMGLGTIVVFRIALDGYAAHPGLRPDAGIVAAALDLHAAEAARSIAASWEISERILTALADETPGRCAHEPGTQGRSLRFGRVVGALAVLEAHGRVDAAMAQASVLANGAPTAHAERIWRRLTTPVEA